MKFLNEVKLTNATIVLADGSTLGMATNGLTYRELSGLFGGGVRASRCARISHITAENWSLLLPPQEIYTFEEQVEHYRSRTAGGKDQTFKSICEAIAHVLGYTCKADEKNPVISNAMPVGSEGTTPAKTGNHDLASDEESSASFEDILCSPVFLSCKRKII